MTRAGLFCFDSKAGFEGQGEEGKQGEAKAGMAERHLRRILMRLL